MNNFHNNNATRKLEWIPIHKPRCAKQRPTYYKTECLDCELIIRVRWERAYVGALPTRHRTFKKEVCPFCEGSHIKMFKINEQQYIEINQKWDIVTSVEKDEKNLDDDSSWIVCET
ncbi:MAG: hypothetical protein DRR19_22325 [Candidatus Parabeggiatoa sp. nov. 1]|nr:MAG: hypothetical protein DRR19_22325 [Gammaproteobacteria bacterium]